MRLAKKNKNNIIQFYSALGQVELSLSHVMQAQILGFASEFESNYCLMRVAERVLHSPRQNTVIEHQPYQASALSHTRPRIQAWITRPFVYGLDLGIYTMLYCSVLTRNCKPSGAEV